VCPRVGSKSNSEMVEERNLSSSRNDIASTNYRYVRYNSIFTTSINRRLTTTVLLAFIGTCLVFFHGLPFSAPSHDGLLSPREGYIQQLLPVSLSRDTRLHRLSRQLLEKSADKTPAETLTETSTETSKKTSKRASKGTSTYVDGHIPDHLLTVLRQRLLSANTSTNTSTSNTINTNATTNTTSTSATDSSNDTNNESSTSTTQPPPPPPPPTHRTLALANIRTYTVTVQNLIDSLAVANRCDAAVAGVGMAQCNLRSAWAYCAATLTAQVSACYCVTVLLQ
jgi:hypothetical protein